MWWWIAGGIAAVKIIYDLVEEEDTCSSSSSSSSIDYDDENEKRRKKEILQAKNREIRETKRIECKRRIINSIRQFEQRWQTGSTLSARAYRMDNRFSEEFKKKFKKFVPVQAVSIEIKIKDKQNEIAIIEMLRDKINKLNL